MSIIKITQQNWKTINPTKTGIDNDRLDSEHTILFNTNEKGEMFFNQLFKKGLLRKDAGGYRFLF